MILFVATVIFNLCAKVFEQQKLCGEENILCIHFISISSSSFEVVLHTDQEGNEEELPLKYIWLPS